MLLLRGLISIQTILLHISLRSRLVASWIKFDENLSIHLLRAAVLQMGQRDTCSAVEYSVRQEHYKRWDGKIHYKRLALVR